MKLTWEELLLELGHMLFPGGVGSSPYCGFKLWLRFPLSFLPGDLGLTSRLCQQLVSELDLHLIHRSDPQSKSTSWEGSHWAFLSYVLKCVCYTLEIQVRKHAMLRNSVLFLRKLLPSGWWEGLDTDLFLFRWAPRSWSLQGSREWTLMSGGTYSALSWQVRTSWMLLRSCWSKHWCEHFDLLFSRHTVHRSRFSFWLIWTPPLSVWVPREAPETLIPTRAPW